MTPKKSNKKIIKEMQDKILKEIESNPDMDQDTWNRLMNKYKAYEEMTKSSFSVSPDTIMTVAGNLIGIVLILKHEELNVITSKALSFIMKGRA